MLIKLFGGFLSQSVTTEIFSVCKYFNRKVKDNEELEVATKLAQKEEMERLQRLQEIQEQLWQQAAMDLRLHKQKEVTPSSPAAAVELECPAVKLEESVLSPTAAQPMSLFNCSATTGDWCFGDLCYKMCIYPFKAQLLSFLHFAIQA